MSIEINRDVVIEVTLPPPNENRSFLERIMVRHDFWKNNSYYRSIPYFSFFTGVVACGSVVYGKSGNDDDLKILASMISFIGLAGIGTVASCLINNKNNVRKFKNKLNQRLFYIIGVSLLYSIFTFYVFNSFFYLRSDCKYLCQDEDF